ncbi:MAG: hypothetical protein AAFY21_11440 [Cyanobacteria bacterium J06641_2]
MNKKCSVFAVRILITQHGLRLAQRLRKLKMRLVASLKNSIDYSPDS